MLKKLARMMPVGAVLFQAGTCTQQDLAVLASALDEIAILADEVDPFEGDPDRPLVVSTAFASRAGGCVAAFSRRDGPRRGPAMAAAGRPRRARQRGTRLRRVPPIPAARRNEPACRRRRSRIRSAPARAALSLCRPASARTRSPGSEARRTARPETRDPLEGRNYAYPDGAPRASGAAGPTHTHRTG